MLKAGCDTVVVAAIRCCAVLAAAWLPTQSAAAHEPYTSFMTPFGRPCCGEEDCFPLAEEDCFPLAKGDVSAVRGGYFIGSRREFVPDTDAQPGPDDRYHLCTFNGLRMCFLIPPAGT